MNGLFHPANNIIAQLIPMGVGGAVKNGINISLKNVHRAFIVCVIEQGADATQTTFTLQQSSGNAGSAAGTGEKALTNTVDLYYNENCALSNLLTKGTAAKSYQTDINQSRTKMVVFDVIPEQCMDLAGGFDCLVVNTSDPAAANVAAAFAILVPRYGPLPTVFSD